MVTSVVDPCDALGMTAPQDAARVEALRRLHLLDTPPEERFDRITRIARMIFGVSSVAVNLIDHDRQVTKAAQGRISPGEGPRSESLCTYTVQQPDTLEIPDTLADATWASHPAVTGELAVRFYAGVPLRAPGGERVGALCLVDDTPRSLSHEEHELLSCLAELVEHEIASTAEMDQAREVQRRLLPQHSPDLPGWEVAGASVQRGAVGGDFYDWQLLGTDLQLVLCDVMGKGLSAALLASAMRVVTRGASPHHSLAATVAHVAENLSVDLEETGSFVTAFFCRIDHADGSLEYVDAGHGLAFVLERGGGHRRLRSTGLPLGALPDETWTATPETIAHGEVLVVVSDGLLDLYPDVDTLIAAIRRFDPLTTPAVELAGAIAHSGRGRVSDDVTVILARRATS